MEIKNNQLLRFVTAGSVNDGKSTLIGRLLFDSKAICQDQIDSVARYSKNKKKSDLDLSFFTDGLKEERELGITIDVAYRYFTTLKRKFIIADSPGHIPFTKNMFTAASTANVIVILVDVRYGILEQTKRHAFITSLLKIDHLIVCFNKMDLINYQEHLYLKKVSEFKAFAKILNIKNVIFIPISALLGDNVTKSAVNMKWYLGKTLLDHLESISIDEISENLNARFPVQSIIKKDFGNKNNFKGYIGRLSGGVLRDGDNVVIMPSGITSTITSIYASNRKIEEAFAPMSICISLSDNLDISRGDMVVSDNYLPNLSRSFEVILCWFHQELSDVEKEYRILHCNSSYIGKIKDIFYKININTSKNEYTKRPFSMNEIGRVKIETLKLIPSEAYQLNKRLGSIVLIDILTNETLAAGMII